jgi:hypothetical protein
MDAGILLIEIVIEFVILIGTFACGYALGVYLPNNKNTDIRNR